MALVQLLGSARDAAPVYGSVGFTTYTDAQLVAQLGGWANDGLKFVKMKIGTDPQRDPHRVEVARRAIGEQPGLCVDANGAYSVKQALYLAQVFAGQGVTWFEEPVSSDDLPGLHFIREHTPAGMDVAAGEYGYTSRISKTCWLPARWMSCRRMRPGRMALPDFWQRVQFVPRINGVFHLTARPANTCIRAAPSIASGIWNIFTIMRASSACLRRILRTGRRQDDARLVETRHRT